MEEQELLKKAKVLLISSIQEDYDKLIAYGFQNVDYFKSHICAEHYFEKHEDRLEVYHILISGQKLFREYSFNNIDNKIKDISKKEGRVSVTSLMNRQTQEFPYQAYIGTQFMMEKTYEELLGDIVKYALFSRVVEQIKKDTVPFQPIMDFVKKEKLPFPKKKQDLKILFLETFQVESYSRKLANDLGLRVFFEEDDNYAIMKNIKSHLGEYDIIIASKSFSSILPILNTESTEQCKETGRNLTLLMTYESHEIGWLDEDNKYDSDGFGNKINLCYSFGGEYETYLENGQKEYCIMRKENFSNYGLERATNFVKGKFLTIKSSLEVAVQIYNDALKTLNISGLKNLDLKTSEKYDKEYKNLENAENMKKGIALEQIKKMFSDLNFRVRAYLDYKEKGLAPKVLDGLRITETNIGILVEILINEIVYGSILLPKKQEQNNLKMQTRTSKGKLKDQVVSFYTKSFENLDKIPPRLNEVQEKTFCGICKRVENVIVPLNEIAYSQYMKLCRKNRVEKETESDEIVRRKKKD